jgi:hypothetical protein
MTDYTQGIGIPANRREHAATALYAESRAWEGQLAKLHEGDRYTPMRGDDDG